MEALLNPDLVWDDRAADRIARFLLAVVHRVRLSNVQENVTAVVPTPSMTPYDPRV